MLQSQKKPDVDIGLLFEKRFGFKPEIIIFSDTKLHSVAGIESVLVHYVIG